MAKKEDFLENIADALFKKFGVGDRYFVFEIIDPKYGYHKHIYGKARISHKGTVHFIRYAPAFDTPFVKEQKVATGAAVKLKGVNFNEKKVYAPKSDPCLQKFLLMHPQCKQRGGKLFDIHDEDAKRAARLAISRIKREATVLLNDNYDLVKLIPVAVVLQPENTTIARMDVPQVEEIITSYIDSEPQKVIDAFNNDEAELLYHFNKAISQGLITVDSLNHKVIWTEHGGKIFDIPHGIPAHRRWIGYINTQDGQVVYETIKEQFDD